MNGKIIRVGIDGTVTYHNWPEGTYAQQNKFLRELIGPDCTTLEHVMPVHLYDEWGITNKMKPKEQGKVVGMLVDEEGLINQLPLNIVASWLYGSMEHGQPIVGSVVFVGERMTEDGVEFCSIEEMTFRFLYKKLEAECNKAKRIVAELEAVK